MKTPRHTIFIAFFELTVSVRPTCFYSSVQSSAAALHLTADCKEVRDVPWDIVEEHSDIEKRCSFR